MSYEKYFKDVSGYDVIDVYRAHRIFGLTDEVLCHASKKLLLSGVRTGGKTLEQDVREARDSLNRWLEMLQEDLGNAQEEDGWTPEAIKAAAFPKELTLEDAIGDAELSDWARWVFVDADGDVFELEHRPALTNGEWAVLNGKYRCIKDITPPHDFTKCIWEIKK